MEEVFNIVNEHTREPAVNPVAKVIREGLIVGTGEPHDPDRQGRTRTADRRQRRAHQGRAGPGRGSRHGLPRRRASSGGSTTPSARAKRSRARSWRAAFDCIVTIDQAGQIVEFNPAAERTFGYSRAEAAGQIDGRPDGAPSLAQDHLRGIAPFLTSGETPFQGRRIEVAALRADGSQIPVEMAIAPIRLDQKLLFTAYLRDITDRKRHEEERERLLVAEQAARAEAEEANRAKDQFLAVLSHELRTPLNPILLAVTAMLERPPPPEEVRPTLEMIRQNVNLQARLIDDLLDVMRIVRGKMPLHWEVADGHRTDPARPSRSAGARSSARSSSSSSTSPPSATTSTPTRPGSSRSSGT